MAQVRTLVIPQPATVPGGAVTGPEFATTAAEAATSKRRVIDLADFVDVTGTTDATSGLASALTAAETALAANEAPTLYLRSGASLTVSGSIEVPDALADHFALIGDGPHGAQITATTADPLLVLDPTTTPASGTRRHYWRLENLELVGPGTATSGSLGIDATNGYMGHAENVTVRAFETGVLYDSLDLANGAAAYYNMAVNLRARFNGVGIHLRGLANANAFYGGQAAGNDTGVFIEDETTGCFFHGIDIESNTSYGARIQGNRNTLHAYWENPSGVDVYFDETGTTPSRNVIDGFMSSVPNITWDTAKNNWVRRPGSLRLGAQQISDEFSVHAKRISAKSDQALYEGHDAFSGSGNPIGYRYRTQRHGYRHFHSQYSADGTTWYDTFKAGTHPSTGNPIVYLSDGSSANGTQIIVGTGDPNGVWVGRIGDLFLRTDGGAGTSLYTKTSGNGTNTGWTGV